LTNSLILLLGRDYIELLGIILLCPFGQNHKLKFIFVMIIYPMIFSIIQIWIFDNILKKSEIPYINYQEKEDKLSSTSNLFIERSNKEDNNTNNDKNKNKIELNNEKSPLILKEIEFTNDDEIGVNVK
jgi:hypothetical protein